MNNFMSNNDFYDEEYWRDVEEFNNYLREHGDKNPSLPRVGWTHDEVIARHERIAGVPHEHPDFSERFNAGLEKAVKKLKEQ